MRRFQNILKNCCNRPTARVTRVQTRLSFGKVIPDFTFDGKQYIMIFDSDIKKKIKLVQPLRPADTLSVAVILRRYISILNRCQFFKLRGIGHKDDDKKSIAGKGCYSIPGFHHFLRRLHGIVIGTCSFIQSGVCIAKFGTRITKSADRSAKGVVHPKMYFIRIVKFACCLAKVGHSNFKDGFRQGRYAIRIIKYIDHLINPGVIITKYASLVIHNDYMCFGCLHDTDAGRARYAFSRLISITLVVPRNDQRLLIIQQTGICSLGRLPPVSSSITINS